MVGIGLLIVGPLHDLPAETGVNRWFEARRTAGLNSLTLVLSNFGQTQYAIAVCVLVVALFWWRTRQWWLAVVPAIALGLQAVLFFTSSLLVGRGRPDVALLDDSPPTTAFPSGHTSASTALYVSLALLCQRITRPWLRWGLTVGLPPRPVRRRDGAPLPRHAPPHGRARRHGERPRVRVPRLVVPAAGRVTAATGRRAWDSNPRERGCPAPTVFKTVSFGRSDSPPARASSPPRHESPTSPRATWSRPVGSPGSSSTSHRRLAPCGQGETADGPRRPVPSSRGHVA